MTVTKKIRHKSFIITEEINALFQNNLQHLREFKLQQLWKILTSFQRHHAS